MKMVKARIALFWMLVLALFAATAPLRADDEGQVPEKKTVAVVDFSAKSMSVVIGPGVQDYQFSSEYIDLLNSELITALVNDPTFNVIDRARLRDLAKNGELANATPDSMAELGKAAGADYIVSGNVELLELDKQIQEFPGYTQAKLVGHMVVNLRIVDIATSRVIQARKIDDVFPMTINEYTTISLPSFMERLKSDVVRRLVISISENISPIEIAAVHDGRVYLDRGEQAFSGGEILEIVIEADKIYDKDGNILDIVEEHAGKVRVDTVRQKVSIATIIEESRPLQVGWIARRVEE
jgi:TolB-like protein